MLARKTKKKGIRTSDSLRVPTQMDINCRGHWRTCRINPYMNMRDSRGQGSAPVVNSRWCRGWN